MRWRRGSIGRKRWIKNYVDYVEEESWKRGSTYGKDVENEKWKGEQEAVVWALGGDEEGEEWMKELEKERERMKGNREVGPREEEQRAGV